jgi:biopolymer transport protein ExbB
MLPESLQSGLDLLHRGGWVMIPLMILSVASVTVMVERALFIRESIARSERLDQLMGRVRPLLLEGRPDEAARLCAGERGPVAQTLRAGIEAHRLPLHDIERAMEEVALRQAPLLSHNLGTMDTIITMAPLLGLLGTITGMIQAFNVVSTAGAGAPAAITGGVAEALIATAAGLSIAIMTLPVYNALSEKVKEITGEIELRATQLLNILAQIKHREREAQQAEARKHAFETPVSAVLWRDKAVLPSPSVPR